MTRPHDSKFWMGIIPTAWIIFFFIFPLFIVFKISFSESIFAIPPFTEICSFTKEHILEIKLNFKNYISIFRDSYYLSAFTNSLYLSIVTTILCFFVGFPMAYGIHRVSDRLKTVLLLLVSLSFWTSFLVRIYSWMSLLSVNGAINSILLKLGLISAPIQFIGTYYAVCLGMIFCYLPFMIFPVYAVLEKVDKSYIEVAYDLGCRPTKTFWTVTIPLSSSGIITGSVLVFSASIGEFVIPELLGGADAVTFGRVLWTEFFSNLDWTMACSLSIGMMLFIILPIFIFQKRTRS
ncbi:MAG: ABC transporter permease subunit [Alphaproteobacteria bacterium]|nr:ABC transporter permease subunit [Alphaproteobacteria bacterium]MBQ3946222.1 ABC transporter permease subunit [Alphaproteobacteria bacterium]